MDRILHVISSPRAGGSYTRRITDEVVAALAARHPDATVDTLDLWRDPVPTFGAGEVDAKMTVIGGATPAGAAGSAWASIRRVFDRFAAADTYVFGVPMWNSGIPWILKHYIDTLSQPGLLFAFDPATGYQGLLGGRRAVVAYTSAVWSPDVPPAFGRDFHSTYFEDWLRFAGIDDIHTLRLQPTFSSADGDLEARTAAVLAEARDLAADLAGTAPAPAATARPTPA